MMFGNSNAASNGADWPELNPEAEIPAACDIEPATSSVVQDPESPEPELTNELRIVEAVSLIDLSEQEVKSSNIQKLVDDVKDAQDTLEYKKKRLSQLRQEKEDGNFISNWFHDRNDKIRDAQSNLSQAIGELTSRSSDLLIVNTAIAKVLQGQQRSLILQQRSLGAQADEIAQQNEQIKEQQILLEKNQKEINLANQGLLEAKGLTQTQAQQLVGCVRRVEEAEGKILEAQGKLIEEANAIAEKTAADCAETVRRSLSQFDDAHLGSERRMEARLAEHRKGVESELDSRAAETSKQLDALLRSQSDTAAKLDAQGKSLKSYRTVAALALIAAVAALAWLAASQMLRITH